MAQNDQTTVNNMLLKEQRACMGMVAAIKGMRIGRERGKDERSRNEVGTWGG